jgi:hypothetical protein
MLAKSLSLRKLPHYIRDLINPWEFQEPETLIQRCNEIWEDLSEEEGAASASAAAAAATATLRPHSRSSSSPFRGKGPPAKSPASAAHPPPAHPGAAAATTGASTTPVLAPKPRSARRAAHTRKTSRLAVGSPTAAAGPTQPCCPPPPLQLNRHQPQPCLSYQQKTKFSFKIQRTILNFWLIRVRRYQFYLIPWRRDRWQVVL